MKYGAKAAPIAKERVPNISAAAIEWFSALAQHLGAAIEDRERTIASSPAVLAALGAVAHPLVEISDPDARAAERDRLIYVLDNVHWIKGKHWEGIAGKYTPKGEFSVCGPKETAYAIHSALIDATSPGFSRIRALEAPVPP